MKFKQIFVAIKFKKQNQSSCLKLESGLIRSVIYTCIRIISCVQMNHLSGLVISRPVETLKMSDKTEKGRTFKCAVPAMADNKSYKA